MSKTPARRKRKRKPSRAVAIRKPQVPQTEAQTFMSFVERAAKDPTFDVDKFKALLDMKQAEQARIAEEEFNRALTHVQTQVRTVLVDSDNPAVKRKVRGQEKIMRYVSFRALDAALRPVYTAAGFAVSFDTEPMAPVVAQGADQHGAPVSIVTPMVRVVCQVSRGGFSRRYSIDVPADGKGAQGGDVMTKTHAVGSATTYGRRYLLAMIFNVTATEDPHDDDGNAAAGVEAPGKISDAQLLELQDLAKKGNANIDAFCAYIGTDMLINLPAAKFADAKAALIDKIRAMGGKI